MKTYYVSVPFAGVMGMIIEAENEDAMRYKAHAGVARLAVHVHRDIEGVKDVEIHEWSTYDQLASGMTLNAPLNELSIDDVEDADED